MIRPRLLFYCQHSLGLGHLVRSLAVADALAGSFDVTLLNGGRLPTGARLPRAVRIENLPPLGHDDDYRLVSLDPDWSLAAAQEERRRRILAALERESPDVILVELYPFGRKKFEFELLPLLEAATARRPRPLVLTCLRDILVRQRRDQAGHDERASQRANTFFDAVLVHSDPAFARLEDTFTPRTPLQIPVHYTGLVTPRAMSSVPDEQRLPRLLVSAGGGMVGEPLFREAVRQHAALAERTGLSTTVIAGPFLPEPAWQWLQRAAAGSPQLDVVRRVEDLCAEIRRSALSLSQAGYNTTMDIIRAGTPAVVVPFSAGREDEQSTRARRLERLGVLRMVPSGGLQTGRLLDELVEMAGSRPRPVRLDLAGAPTTARIVTELARLSPAGSNPPLVEQGVAP